MDDGDWYDGHWWATHARARRWLTQHRPDLVADFRQAFEVLRVPTDFTVPVLDDVVTDAELADLVATVRDLDPVQLEDHELDTFGRHTVHDLFPQLRDRAREMVESLVDTALEPSYDFLSLYGPGGVCDVHLDAPNAMWTLDLVLDQSAPWPLHVSEVVPWPGDHDGPTRVPPIGGGGLRWRELVLDAGQAVVFGGTNQWHGRRPMPQQRPPGHCHLVFLHFVPSGTADLVDPRRWPALFDVPDLAAVVSD